MPYGTKGAELILFFAEFSYTASTFQKVDGRGESAGQLHTFRDTYGGLLEIASLLHKGSDPEVPTMTAIHPARRGRGYRMSTWRFAIACSLQSMKTGYKPKEEADILHCRYKYQ